MMACERTRKQQRGAASRRAAGWIAAALAGAALILGPVSATAQGKVQKVSGKLLDRAGESLKKIGEAEKQLGKVMDRYGTMLDRKSVKDRRKGHAKVRDELKDLQKRVRDVRDASRDMEKEASRFFSEWQKGLDRLQDRELRSLSRQSLTASQESYGRIVAAGRDVADQYDAFAGTLGSQLQYLELDLSDEAIRKLESSNQDLRGEARELQSRVATLKTSIRAYINGLK